MSYIVEQDLIDELGEEKLVQLTDNTGGGEVDHARVAKAISYAVGVFEAYARTRYTLPVPATEVVKSKCLDLAVFHLYKSRATTDEGVYKIRKDAHDESIKFLRSLQEGKAALDVPATEETLTNPASSDQVLKGGSKSAVFSDTKLRGF